MGQNNNAQRRWTSLPAVLSATLVCCILWGSAFPCIKIGYALFSVPSSDTASQMLFAGFRFTLAGVLVIAAGSLMERKWLRPAEKSAGNVVILAFLQTAGQYFFFYTGLAHASGVNASIIEGAGTFITILVAAFVFRTEHMTVRKTVGSLIGFAGVLMVEMRGSGALQFHFALNGEGCILLSAVLAAFSSSWIKRAGQNEDPTTLSGYQFLLGGILLTLYGWVRDGRLHIPGATWKGALLIIYMAFISAAAYTIWSILLKYNPVSRIAIFGFMNPVIGVLLSAVLLGETAQAFRVPALAALMLVSAGIIIVNYGGRPGKSDAGFTACRRNEINKKKE